MKDKPDISLNCKGFSIRITLQKREIEDSSFELYYSGNVGPFGPIQIPRSQFDPILTITKFEYNSEGLPTTYKTHIPLDENHYYIIKEFYQYNTPVYKEKIIELLNTYYDLQNIAKETFTINEYKTKQLMNYEYTINYLNKQLSKLEHLDRYRPNEYMVDQISELKDVISMLNNSKL